LIGTARFDQDHGAESFRVDSVLAAKPLASFALKGCEAKVGLRVSSDDELDAVAAKVADSVKEDGGGG